MLSTWRLIPNHNFLIPPKIADLFFRLDLIGTMFIGLRIFFGQTMCSFFVCWILLEPLAKSWIDSLLSFCCTCFAPAAVAIVVAIVPGVVDGWCCNFDVSFIWKVVCSIAVCCGIAAMPGCCVGISGTLAIVGTDTFAVILAWDWMFRDFNNGGFLIDAENANPRRKIALTSSKLAKREEEEEEETKRKMIMIERVL